MPTTPKGEKKGNGVGSMAKDFLRILKGNWALLIVMIVQLFFTFNTILSDMINTYYLNYTLGSPALITGLGVALVAIGAMVGQFFYPYIEERVGSCKTFMIFGDICYLVLLVLCYVAGNTSTGLYLVMLVILNLFTGALQINVINLCFEVCDRLEYETGIRQDASIFAIVSFLMKLAAGLASTIAGFGLSMVGFEGMGPVSIDVTPAMASGVAVLRFLMPGIFVAVSLIAVLFYPIKKDDVTTIRAELRRRHHGEPQQQ